MDATQLTYTLAFLANRWIIGREIFRWLGFGLLLLLSYKVDEHMFTMTHDVSMGVDCKPLATKSTPDVHHYFT